MTDPNHAHPVFVVGSGRSGTTLVRAMLAAHSRIAVPPETHFLKFSDMQGAATRDAPEDFVTFWETLIARRQFRDIDVEPDRVLEKTKDTGGRTFRGIFLAMLAVHAEKTGKVRPGEKTPGHYRYLERLFRWYPGARVIALRRDPRAVVASHLGSPWVTQQLENRGRRAPLVPRLRLFHVAERARLWTEAYGRFLAGAEADPRICLLSYEALVADPARHAEAMTDFLGEPFEPAMIEDRGRVPGSAAQDRLGSARWRDWVRDHERKASAPISQDGVEKWRRVLTPLEIAVVESACGPIMDRFGYARATPVPGRRAGVLARAALGASWREAKLRHGLRRLGTARRP